MHDSTTPIQQLIALRDRNAKTEAFKNNDTALKYLQKADSNCLNSNELIYLASTFRGCAIYINCRDDLKSTIPHDDWTKIMSSHSWDAAIENEGNLKKRYNF